ncbi:ABC transporter permease [Legionella cardiaca]|uniref:ABC transporter permease n=1 Tax=Legionella cardiaca TaxID=1071983 RepID=A0ABY8AQ47_9GAMM|nr:ABC transporter permease [Legionella cardiaca]WED42830.1 ABC transporter permease [Legionella cardiaca]
MESTMNYLPNRQQHINLLRIAFIMLISSRKKFIGMLIGATFATFIVTQQPSIYQGVTERLTKKIRLLGNEIDLWVMSESSFSFEHPTNFTPMDIYRIRSIPGILEVTPLYVNWLHIQHLPTKSTKVWQIIGVDPDSLIGLPRTMSQGERLSIRHTNAMIVDGYSLQQFETKNKHTLAIGDKMVQGQNAWIISGVTKPIRTYSHTPVAYISSNHLPNIIHTPSFLLIKIKPSFDRIQVANNIQKITGYSAFTPAQFIERSNKFFREKTPIVISFISVAVLGFIIGLIIMWQIFNDFIITHNHQYGMLKMLGVGNFLLIKIVLFQAAVVGILGYLLGLMLTALFGFVFHDTTVAFHLTWQISLLGAIGAIVIIIFSSLLSLLRVIRLDTIDLCRNLI